MWGQSLLKPLDYFLSTPVTRPFLNAIFFLLVLFLGDYDNLMFAGGPRTAESKKSYRRGRSLFWGDQVRGIRNWGYRN